MKLKRGKVIEIEGIKFRVRYVNECRAYCVPTVKLERTVGGRTFRVQGHGINISPNSEVAA